MPSYLLPLHYEPEQPARCSQPHYDWRWSDISEAITCTYEVDVTVEDINSDPPTPKTTGEVSVTSDAKHYSPKAFRAFPPPVDASRIDRGASADALDPAASKISIDTASTILGEGDQALNASHVSASTSVTIFAESMPACIQGRLIPPPILLWLRSRLNIDGKCSVPAVLAVAWWQPILMRSWPLNSNSTVVSYRLHPKLPSSYSKNACWWRGISTKNPSADRLNRVCGDYRLVYLRTTNVLNVCELKSSLRQHWLYRSYRILATFPFAKDLWEILTERDYVDRFIGCAEACNYLVEKTVRPGSPIERSSDFRDSFEACLRARERLIARASIAQLASGDNELASCVAAIYCDLVKLYRCYDAYNIIVSILLATDQPAYPPGWSCIIGLTQYPTNNAAQESVASKPAYLESNSG